MKVNIETMLKKNFSWTLVSFYPEYESLLPLSIDGKWPGENFGLWFWHEKLNQTCRQLHMAMLMILTLDVLARIEYQCEMLTSMTKSLTCPICVALKLAINLTGNPRSTLHRDWHKIQWRFIGHMWPS